MGMEYEELMKLLCPKPITGIFQWRATMGTGVQDIYTLSQPHRYFTLLGADFNMKNVKADTAIPDVAWSIFKKVGYGVYDELEGVDVRWRNSDKPVFPLYGPEYGGGAIDIIFRANVTIQVNEVPQSPVDMPYNIWKVDGKLV